ncbi:MAG: L-threonylcarbamoyladenylate synthase [Alphaproteobacteria bacterium]|nr:L-threonylcarbamoyladenylate synthase [Alphaproteobacteria bacterium]
MPIILSSSAVIIDAARHLRAGGLGAAPTETVYGLFGDATNPAAIQAIFDVKGRPQTTPLIVHIGTLAAARELAEFDSRAAYLAQRLWPGPITLILRQKPGNRIAPVTTSGQATIGLRMPDNPVALQLLAETGRPLAAPSANFYSRVSPTTAAHVQAQLGNRLTMIIDGGACTVGLESTILDLSTAEARLLRPGGITRETIEASIGEISSPIANPGSVSGSAVSHYAPRLPLRPNAYCPIDGELENLLSFGPNPLAGFADEFNLSLDADLKQAAARLYAGLRSLDTDSARPGQTIRRIAVMPIPNQGIGIAINDRLLRAAAPRDQNYR